MDSIPATCPTSLGNRFASVLIEASLWLGYHGPTLMHIESKVGSTDLDVSSGGEGGAVV